MCLLVVVLVVFFLVKICGFYNVMSDDDAGGVCLVVAAFEIFTSH